MSYPPDPQDQDLLRIGTVERDEATQILARHSAEGRLMPEEYDGRLAILLAASTKADVRRVFADLPQPHPSFLFSVPTPPQAGYAAHPAAPVTFHAGYPAGPPHAGYPVPGVTPGYPTGYSDKSKIVAGVLQIVLPFGTGRFYTGHTGIAVAQLLVTIFTLGIGGIWPLIDGIVILASGGTDQYGRRLQG